jgi:GTP-binding protein HflX
MERALLITVDLGRRSEWTAEERAEELKELARSAGAGVVRSIVVNRHEPAPSHYIGKGKVEELAALRAAEKVNLVIFNNGLSGTQAANLEDAVGARVIDRTQLILDIFARRACSNEGKVQVELAQLMYRLPRLVGKGTELSRLGGGIGTVGPGEQKLEVDRRRIRQRIFRLEKDLEALKLRRSMMQKKRDRFSLPTVALVGYTNAGKSTLLNALTGSDAIVQDKLFSTLDPTVRQLMLPGMRKVLFVDTVGFLADLPHQLIEAFKATLEEVVEADLMLHLVDASHPKAKEQAHAVYGVLDEIGVKDKPVVTVLNKVDKAEAAVVERLKNFFPGAVAISALNRVGFPDLLSAIQSTLRL